MNNIIWKSTLIKIKDLNDNPNNPRVITADSFKKLVSSLKQDGYHQRLIVDHTNTIISGHQRKRALKQAGFKDSDEIEVLYPNRPLTKEEIDRVGIRSNVHAGKFDYDMLANNFSDYDLYDWGVEVPKIDMAISEPEEQSKERCEHCNQTIKHGRKS